MSDLKKMSESPQWTAEQIEAMKKGDPALPRQTLPPAVMEPLRGKSEYTPDKRPLHEQILGIRLW